MENNALFILESATVKDALKQLDHTAEKALFVVNDQNQLRGTITDGDIRRFILKGHSLENSISETYNKNPITLRKEQFSVDEARQILVSNKIGLLPIVDEKNIVIDYITWDKVFSSEKPDRKCASLIDVPVVIMAGGKGVRMDPFTRILPKPLIPIGDKAIVEIIMDDFLSCGVEKFYLTLNYKGEMIEAYFNSIDKKYPVKFLWEKEFLGTAGSLKLVEDENFDTIIVSNCDIIVKANFEDVLQFHKEQKAAFTALSSIQHHKIPYGVIQFREGGEITTILEKPEYSFTINTGMYVINRECIDYIPRNSYLDMPDLIALLLKQKKKVLMYPVNENDYIDIGQWEEYKSVVKKLQVFA
jgi:dTDP-glucose pyrophosphorylase